MKLTKNFTLKEFIKSDTAQEKGIPNNPTGQHLINLTKTALALQHIRDIFGEPIIVTSGYRSKELNAAIPGSSKTSDHSNGLAVDFKVYNIEKMKKLQELCISLVTENKIRVDQLIIEHPVNGVAAWLHIGIGSRMRQQVLYT